MIHRLFCFSYLLDMPVVEDGLSDSENISIDEHSPPLKLPVLTKSTRNHSPTHKHQHAKPLNSQMESFQMPEKPQLDDSSIIATGRLIFPSGKSLENKERENLDKKLPRKKGLFRMFIL